MGFQGSNIVVFFQVKFRLLPYSGKSNLKVSLIWAQFLLNIVRIRLTLINWAKRKVFVFQRSSDYLRCVAKNLGKLVVLHSPE